MDKKAQLTIGFIIKLIIGIAVLAIILVFATGKVRQGSEAIGAASPQEKDLAITSCESACDRAGLASAGGGTSSCSTWQDIFCRSTVVLGGQQVSCHGKDSDGFKIICEGPCDCGDSSYDSRVNLHSDNDGINDAEDNCITVDNPDQEDLDNDNIGDACDPDDDGDGVDDSADNCPKDSNSDQANADNDGQGDACDTCTDTDGDGYGNPGTDRSGCSKNAPDNCPEVPDPSNNCI